MAIPMVFELGRFIRNIQLLRIMNMFSAIAYNTVFVISVLDLFFGLYFEDKNDFDDAEQGPVNLML